MIHSHSFIHSRDVAFDKKKSHNFDSGYSLKPDLHFYCPTNHDSQAEAQDVKIIDGEDDHDDTDDGQIEAGKDTEPIHHNQPVGAIYEDNFMMEAECLGPKRQHKPLVRFHKECYTADVLTADTDKPINIWEAWTGKHSVHCKEATNSEYNSLMSNYTWDLVPPPQKKNVVGSHWGFKVKCNAGGSVKRFKVCLVAQV